MSPNQDISTYAMKMDQKNPLVLFDLMASFDRLNLEAFSECKQSSKNIKN